MLHKTGNAAYPVSQSPNTRLSLGSILISLFLFTPNKVDSVASTNQILSIFLFLLFILYPIKASCFWPVLQFSK